MRKFAALSLALLLTLTGCGSQSPAHTTEVPETAEIRETDDALNVAPEAPKPKKPMPDTVMVRYDLETREGSSQDGKIKVLQMEENLGRAYIPHNPAAEKAVNQALEGLQTTFWQGGNTPGAANSEGYDALLSQARDSQTEIGDGFAPYYLSLRSRVMRGDLNVLSLQVRSDAYLGGAHGYAVESGWVFDSQTGKRLELKDLAQDPQALENFVLDQLVSRVSESPELQQHIAWFQQDEYREQFSQLLTQGSWLLDEQGLRFFSQEYQFGPHAAGVLQVTIPYGDLADLMKPQYLKPAAAGTGSLSLSLPNGCNARILDDLVLDPGGEILMLEAQGRVDRAELVEVNLSGQVYEREPIWFGSSMEDCVVRLEVNLDPNQPDLMLKYTDQSGDHQVLLLPDGGGYTLKPIN